MNRREKSEEKNLLKQIDDLIALVQLDFETLAPLTRLSSLLRVEEFGLPEQQLWAKTVRAIRDDPSTNRSKLLETVRLNQEMICCNFKSLTDFCDWLYRNKHQKFIIRFSVLREISSDGNVMFSYDSPNNENLIVRVYTPSDDGPSKHAFELEVPPEFIPFVKRFEGIDLSRLKKCENENCEKLFIQTGERERRFCCRRCQNTTLARQRFREKNHGITS